MSKLGGYTREEWRKMIEDKVVAEPSQEVLEFIKSEKETMIKIKIDIWKESGKYYTTELVKVNSIDEITNFMLEYQRYKGMEATVYYEEEDRTISYWQPYRKYKL